MLSIKMKSLSFSTGMGTYISLQIPAHLFPRAFFIMMALVYQNDISMNTNEIHISWKMNEYSSKG